MFQPPEMLVQEVWGWAQELVLLTSFCLLLLLLEGDFLSITLRDLSS
jgi:hypothetical protein